MSKDEQTAPQEFIRARGFPRIGLNHSVAKLPSYVKISVTTEEYELVIAHRKQVREDQERGELFLQARESAVSAYHNYKA